MELFDHLNCFFQLIAQRIMIEASEDLGVLPLLLGVLALIALGLLSQQHLILLF
jgi:hypothetical protein